MIGLKQTLNLANLFNQSNLDQYVAYLKSTSLSDASLKRKLSSLASFQKFLVKKNIIESLPQTKLNLRSKIYGLKSNFLRSTIDNLRSKSLATYLLLASLLIISSGIGYTLYRQAITRAKTNLAYTTASNPIYANRYLSFQGRLTDSSGNPITSENGIIFELYNNPDVGVGTTLYTSASGNSQTVTFENEENGVFSVTIGKSHGTTIPDSVFTQNSAVYLQITAGGEVMSPRQSIATVAYAINAESLQGLPPSASGLKDTMLVIDGSGNLNLGESNPAIIASSTAPNSVLRIEGQAVLIKATDTYGGNIEINPDANGIIKLTTEGFGSTAVGGFINATNANLSTGNLYNATIGNNNRGYNFISFNNFNSGIGNTQFSTRFSVDASGNTFIGGTLSPTTISIGNTILTSSAVELNYLDGTLVTAGSVIYGNGSNLSNTDVGVSGEILMSNATGTPVWINASSVGIGTTYAADNGLTLSSGVFKLGGALTENTRLNIGATEVMYFQFVSGNIGIGTTNPTQKLDVNGSINLASGQTYNIGSSQINLNNLSDVLTSTPAADQILTFNGYQWVNTNPGGVSAGAGINFYLDDSSADISTYNTLFNYPTGGTEITDSTVVNNNTVLKENYISDALGDSQIDGGDWQFDTYDFVDTTANVSEILIDVYKRNVGGTETLLFSTSTGEINNTQVALNTVISVQTSFPVNATDRLVVKYSAKTTNTSDTTVSYTHNGTDHYTHIHTPLVTRHNNLAGLQGGLANEYYHLNATEYTGSGTGVFARINSPIFTGGIGVTGNSVFSTGVTATVLSTTGNLSVGGTLAVTGRSTFAQNVFVNAGGIGVTGNSIFSTGVTATVLSTTGNLSVGGTLAVTGRSTFDQNVFVNAGGIGVTGNSVFSDNVTVGSTLQSGSINLTNTSIGGSNIAAFLSGTSGLIGYLDTTAWDKNAANNYASWNLQANSVGTTAILTGNTVNFVNGVGISLSQSGSTITINNNSVGTTYTAGNGLTLSSGVFKLGGALTENTRLNIGTTEVMYFQFATGNVGIGTTNPTQKLSVSGGPISQADFADGDKFLLLGKTNSAKIAHGTGWNFASYAGALVSDGGAINSGIFTWNSVNNSGVFAERMRLDNAGNVGIGTTNPATKLSISPGAGYPAPTLGTASGAFSILSDNGLYGLYSGISTNGNGWLQEMRSDGTATAYALLLNPSGGNVGIGTTNPGYNVHVKNSVAGSTSLMVEGNGSGYVGNSFVKADGDGVLQSLMYGTAVAGTLLGNTSAGAAYLITNSVASVAPTLLGIGTLSNTPIIFGTSNTERMRILGTGNVGIGTTNPTYKLDVVGNIRSSGTYPYLLLSATGYDSYIQSGVDPVGSATNANFTSFINPAGKGFSFSINGSSKLMVDTTGNVGIGTTNPTSQLEVVGYVKSKTGYLDRNMLDTTSWTIGTGSVGSFVMNGATAENERVWATDPLGRPAIIWKSVNDAASDADGGWGYGGIPIDNNKAYRVSVWIKKQGTTSGSIYLGCDGANTLNLDNTVNGNPYFFASSAGSFVSGRWYLFVGYIHAYNDPSTTSYSAIYDGETGQKIVSGTDYKNRNVTNSQVHRTYNYYDTVVGSIQYFSNPRFEEINGMEPTLEALLGTPQGATNAANSYFGGNLTIAGTGTAINITNPAGVTTDISLQNGETIDNDTDARINFGGSSPYLSLGGTTFLTAGRLFQAANGTVGGPAYSFQADTDSGMYSGGDGILRLATNSVDRITILAAGNVGIGVNPGYKLDVSGTIHGTGDILLNGNFGLGLVGVYSDVRYQNVFSMGAAYRLAADGTTPGNLYGIAWTHENVGGQSKPGLSHQALFMSNGITQTAIGTGIWTIGSVTGTQFNGPATTLIGNQTNWANYRSSAVANMLSWKNYGNGHVIFDASQSTSPTGSAVNNTNSQIAWAGSYPTLMGWNGTNTYGVRVDSARDADTTDGYHLNQAVTSGANVTFGEIYSNSWFSNNNNLTGLYNQAVGAHFYASAANIWNMGGGGAYPQLIFRDNHQSTIRGYVYSDASGFGLLHSGGGWGFRLDPGTDEVYMPGNVGIGTADPVTKLHVVGTTETARFSGGGAPYITVGGGQTSTTGAYIQWDDNANVMHLSPHGLQSITINSSGNVGINTAAQANKLEVRQDIYTDMQYGYPYDSSQIQIRGASNPNRMLQMGYDTSHNYGWIRANEAYVNSTLLVVQPFGNVGIGNWANVYKLEVQGDGVFRGSVYSSTYGWLSDERLKENIQPIANSLETLMQINGKSFDWRKDEFPDKNLPGGLQYGMIAQDVEKVLPDLVSTMKDGYKTINYAQFIPFIIESIKEQQGQIASISEQLAGVSLTPDGQINIDYNVSPEVLASLGYEGAKNEIESATYSITDTLGATVTRIAQFSEVASAKIKAGLISAQNIIADNAVIKNLRSEKLTSDQIISPLADIGSLNAATATISGILTAQDIQTTQLTADTIITQDLSSLRSTIDDLRSNTATVSTLYADQIISKEGSFGDIMASKISSLRDELKAIVASNLEPASTPDATPSAILAESENWSIAVATDSATITGNLSLTDSLIIGAQLMVNGDSQFSNAFVSGSFTAGQIAISGNSISTLNTALYIQPGNTGSVHIMGDTLVISDNGDVIINGNLSITGSLFGNLITANEIETQKLTAAQIYSDRINIATDSASVLATMDISTTSPSSTESGSLIIASESQIPQATNSAQLTSNATAGTATLPADKTDLIISTDKLTPNSIVYLTPMGSTNNQVLYVKNKVVTPTTETTQSQSYFTISIDQPLTQDVGVNWWIIN